jgi:DNA-binding MarR family transcriptional regulator
MPMNPQDQAFDDAVAKFKKKGQSMSDESNTAAGRFPQVGQKNADLEALPDGASFDAYFLTAHRTVRLLEKTSVLAKHNLTTDQWAVLRLLESNYGPTDIKTLAGSAVMSRKEIQQIVNELSRRGLINAAKSEPTVSLSREGVALLANTSMGIGDIAAAFRKYNVKTFSRFDVIAKRIQNVMKTMRAKPTRSKSGL